MSIGAEMTKTEKKRINRYKIKFQNQSGKKKGILDWLRWKAENGYK